MREIQYFERENISITNGTTSPIDDGEMVKLRTKTLEPTPLTRPTEVPEKNGRVHVPDDLDPDL